MSQCPGCLGEAFNYSKYGDHVKRTMLTEVMHRSRIIFFDPLRFVKSVIRRLKLRAMPMSEKMGITHESSGLWGGNVAVCTQCGHGFLERMPSEEQVKRFYTESYWSGAKISIPLDDETDFARNPRATQQLHFAFPFVSKSDDPKMLEIGARPAFATQLFRSKLNKSQIFVCEAGSQWEPYYQDREISRISSFFPFESDIKFDYIHTSHWLEHVIDVQQTIAQLRGMTRDGGHVFVEVPNTGHGYWSSAKPDHPHLHFFTADSVSRIFELGGFKTQAVGEFGPLLSDGKSGTMRSGEENDPRPGGLWIRALFKAT
jgi:hypothetical protein